MQTVAHEDFIATYFTKANKAKLCAALNAEDLDNALNIFEDTRSEEDVNNMLSKLRAANITANNYVWVDSLEAYTY
jgi:hypothetical protein